MGGCDNRELLRIYPLLYLGLGGSEQLAAYLEAFGLDFFGVDLEIEPAAALREADASALEVGPRLLGHHEHVGTVVFHVIQ